jgi:uncharacterized protein (TIGR02246 family)
MTLPDPVQAELDELAIRRLVDTYCDGVNTKDAATWGSVWAEEGAVWDLAGRVIEGKEAIVGFWVPAVATYALLVQLAPNGVVEIDGDEATGRWWITEQGVSTSGEVRRMLAAYHDTYVREAGGWRIRSRRLEVLAAGDGVP